MLSTSIPGLIVLQYLYQLLQYVLSLQYGHWLLQCPLQLLQCTISYHCVAGTETTFQKTRLFCHMGLEGFQSIMVGEAHRVHDGDTSGRDSHCLQGTGTEAGTRGRYTFLRPACVTKFYQPDCSSKVLFPQPGSHLASSREILFPQTLVGL